MGYTDPMDVQLTDRQAEVLQAITSLTDIKGYPPTVRELETVVGVSVSAVHAHLRRLRDKGAVTWENGQTRTLKVVS